ncbi:MAG TPA: molybdopterin synthase catalytic subunit MoaE [Usitatibacter sp.]|nr:molybdopterin synthase catalytic subunit MoaE [Usitatibacter sp.]
MAIVRVQTQDFDPGRELEALTRGRADVGAVASFVGLVRAANDGRPIRGMTLEHYPGMTEKALEDICREAHSRWSLLGTLVIHRVGDLRPGERIVLVGVSSAHRGEAFAACEFIMDYLKTRAPFWKREDTPQGPRWVEARASDDDAAQRWQEAPGAGSVPSPGRRSRA